MTLNTSSGAGILSPEDVQALVVEPLTRQSVAMQVSTTVQTGSHQTRFPIVVSDPTSGWTAEGAEIDVSDADVDELVVTPSKLAALTVVSNELVQDSDPSALAIVGDGLVRDLQVRLDAAYFGTTVTNGPSGLGALSGIQTVSAGTSFTNLDPFAEALSKAETVDTSMARGFVAHPDTLLALQELKVADTWNMPLLGPDASSPTKRAILGVPAYWSPSVAATDVWLITQNKAFVVMRVPLDVRTDESAFFSSDRTAVRATARIGFAWPHPAAVVKISTS